MADIAIDVAVPDEHIEISAPTIFMASAAEPSPRVAEVGDIKVVQKNALRVALLSIMVSAIWALGHAPFDACSEQKVPHEHLSHAYAVVSFMSFEMGILLLLFSILLPQVPRIIGMAKRLVWVAFVLVHIAVGLKMSTHVTC